MQSMLCYPALYMYQPRMPCMSWNSLSQTRRYKCMTVQMDLLVMKMN